jgi:hypothetical protein
MTIYSKEDYRRKIKGNVVPAGGAGKLYGENELPEEWDYEPEVLDDDFLDPTVLAARQAQLIGVKPSQFVEFAIKLPDKENQTTVPFSFAERNYLRLPYDTKNKRVLFKCGRQVEKSTLLGNRCLAYCCIINAFTVLYVSPTNTQTKVFSRDRLKEPIETSGVIGAWTTSKLSDSVFEKQFINRSKITLRYAYHTADRVRGIPADMILIDEIQDIITDNIPVIEECASHSTKFQIYIYSGTPKSLDNTIEKYWANHSTQNEWVVPCDKHGLPKDPGSWHWNVLGEDHISSKGLICDKCGSLINPRHPSAQWASMNPGVLKKLKKPYEGYRIPQLMVPWIPWTEILDKQAKYSRSQFYNEVLGLSFDAGTRPLTQADVMQCCDPNLRMTHETHKQIKAALGGSSAVYAGIDWGTGEGSFTVLSLGAYLNDIFTIFYVHRFEGQEIEPQIQLDKIQRLIDSWNIKLIATDYGGGFYQNDVLTRRYGKDRILKYQYSQPSQKIKWEPGLKRFLVHRTEVMSDIFSAIKRSDGVKGKIFRFPKWEEFEEPFGADLLNIFSEYNEQLRQVQYKKSPDRTDDTFHSILLCFIGSLIMHPRFDILNPNDRTNAGFSDD